MLKTACQAHYDSIPAEKHLSRIDLFVIQAIFHLIFSEVTYEHCIKDSTTIDMEYRYFHLMERIRATEVKINNYDNKRYYGKEDYDPVVHGLAFSGKSWTKSTHEHDEPMAFQRARALSVPQGPVVGEQVSEADGERNDSFDTGNEGMVREQFSRKTVISGEQGSGISDQPSNVSRQPSAVSDEQETGCSHQQELRETPIPASDDRVMPAEDKRELPEVEIPRCVRILEQATMRSRIQGLDYIGFTEREMRLLAFDPIFDDFQPELAAEMRRALAEVDSG